MLLAGCELVFPIDAPPDGADDNVDGPGEPPDEVRLVAHYTMDALGNQNLIPDAEEDLDAMCEPSTGCPEEVVGVIAGALAFDGLDDHAVVGFDSAFDRLEDGFTITAWLKPVDGTTVDSACVVAKAYAAGAANSWSLCIETLMPAFESLHDTNGEPDLLVATGTLFADGEFHHVAARWDGSTKTVWFDGEQVARQDVEKPVELDKTPVAIAAELDGGSPQRFFAGAIDDLRIYAGALSDLEISQLAMPER